MRIFDKINKSVSNFYTSRQRLQYAFYVLLLLVFVNGLFITRTSFDFDFETFFPEGHPDRKVFEAYKSKFAYDNDFLLIIVENEAGIFDSTFIAQLTTASKTITGLPGTEEVLSPHALSVPVKTSFGFAKISSLHPESVARLQKDSIRIAQYVSFERALFSRDLTSMMMRVKHAHYFDFDTSEQYTQSIRGALTSNGISNYRLVGKASVQSEFVGLIQSDFGVFILLAFIFIILFLKLQYGSWPAVLVPLALIITTNISTLGLMAAMGYSLNVLTVLIPTIISFVAISDVIHFYSKYRLCIEDGMSEQASLLKTVKEIGMATFLTSVTTAIGFLSLLTIRVEPVKLLGLFTAIGVLIAFVYTFILLPFFAMHLSHQKARSTQSWQKLAMRCYDIACSYPRTILLSSVILVSLGVYGLYLVKIDAYLLDDLPDDSPSLEAFTYVDEQYGGTKPWNLYCITEDSTSILQPAYLQELKVVQTYLEEVYGLKMINSPITAMQMLNLSYRGGNRKYYEMPDEEGNIKKLISYNARLQARNMIIQPDSGQYFASISGFIPEWGALRTTEKDQELLAFLDNHRSGKIRYHITGTTSLIDKSHEYLSENLFKGLLFAFCAVALISVLLFRSATMILITLLPNVIPVLLTAAVIGFFNIPIKLTTSIIFAVSFGIAVDDTIHFISRFKIEMQKNNLEQAVKNTFRTAGMAIIQTTVLLTIGFGVFCFSSFGASFFTGLFIVLTLLFALLTDLFLLPVLLLQLFRKSSKDHEDL